MRTPSRLLFGLACLAVAACSSESPATGGLHVALNSDGADPHLATLTAESRTAWLYGSKDADGAPAGVDAIVVDDVPGGRTITVTVDAYGRPLSVGDTTGRVATFAYTDFAAVVTFKGGKAECQKLLGTASTVFTHAGTGLAAIALACALATGPGTPFCVPLLSWQGAFLGLGVAAAGSVSTIGAAKCDDLAIPPDPQQMTVSLTASHALLEMRAARAPEWTARRGWSFTTNEPRGAPPPASASPSRRPHPAPPASAVPQTGFT